MVSGENWHSDIKLWGDIVDIEARDSLIIGVKSNGTVVKSGSGVNDIEGWTNIKKVKAAEIIRKSNNFKYAEEVVGLKEDGTVIALKYPELVVGWTDIVDIDAAYNHIIGLKSDGTVVAAGGNDYGNLNVEGINNIIAISANNNNTLLLKSDGTLIGLGENSSSQNNFDEWESIKSISVNNGNVVGVKDSGEVIVKGQAYHDNRGINQWTNIKNVSVSNTNTLGLKNDGSVVIVGDNSYGQIAANEFKDIVDISVGEGIVVGLKSDGKVVTAGNNSNGQAELENWNNIKKVTAKDNLGNVVGLTRDGKIVTKGQFYNNDEKEILNSWNNIVDIYSNSNIVALDNKGRIYTNQSYEPTNYIDEYIVKIACRYNIIYGLKKDGTVVIINGDDNTRYDLVSNWKDIKEISVSDFHIAGIKKDGTVVSSPINKENPPDEMIDFNYDFFNKNIFIDNKTIKNNGELKVRLENNSYFKANNPTLNGVEFNVRESGVFEINYAFDKEAVGKINVEILGLEDVFGNNVVKTIPVILTVREDINSDDSIDILDLATLSIEYNNMIEECNIDKTYDLNSDGIIDIYDLVYIFKSMD